MTVACDTDVLIAGGGMVGASLAAALAPLSLRVTVVEAAPPRAPGQPSYDDRSTAVSWGSRRIMESLGVWPDLQPAATPISAIHVSDRGRFGVTRLTAAEQDVAALGYVVENRSLGQVFWRAMENAGTDILTPARVSRIENRADAAVVGIAQGDEIREVRTRLLIAADGARSAVRDALGIDAETTRYEQTAVIANVTPEHPHGNVAYERFTLSGPLAFLPMSNGRCSVVWTLPPATADEVRALDDSAFLRALQDAFGHRLGRLVRTGERHAYPLSLVRATQITGARCAVIGNAAHGLHPVAGQGFNLGLRDVAALAEVIADACAGTGDPGDASALRRYSHWRAADHDRVIRFTDGLVRLFSSDFAPLRLARSAGLQVLDLLPGPRRFLARQSMGLSGPLPRLARGIPLR